MKTSSSSQRGLRWGALLLLVALSGVPSYARSHHGEAWARDHFAAAERMREALNGRPPADRTRRDYQRVVNAYRNVYFGAPNSTKADPSVVAAAETLVEMGRCFEADKILNNAITQYKFLRREYPGSKYRFDALFTIGEIYKDDLDDPDEARTTFEEFLRRYPRNRLAEDAQQAIAELDRQAQQERNAANKKAENAKTSARQKSAQSQNKTESAASAQANKSDGDSANSDPNSRAVESASAEHRSGHLPRVTAIRHWSTPDYTRVAIDLESDIEFDSQRIAHPDRIFFDLRSTRLASTLVGKSFDVDDGFLKKIRVAQFQPGRTRVVLEVDNFSDYDAFLLPNPYRLIIDIRGKNAHAKSPKDASELAKTADVESAPKAGSDPDSDNAPTAAKVLRAEAGKAPVTSMDVNDKTKILPKRVAVASHDPDLVPPASGKKTPIPPVKRVVDADDDDDSSATQLAKLDSPDNTNSSARKISVRSQKLSSRAGKKFKAPVFDAREAQPTASGDRSLIRALGLKIGKIVIDPGHGGHDTGTIGPNGLEEKDLVLEVGRRLGKLLETRLGAEVFYTRRDDTFIPLETRTAIANQERADLFISIHANSSQDPDARGVETYYLNFSSSPGALEVAARENAVSEKSIYELQDLVKKIALKEKIEESREFAGDVQESLHSGLAAKSPAIRNRGVKKAPFIVLIGANMPSILAEISFVSNPTDEHRLRTSDYRQRIAESLYRGIAKYAQGLSGVKVAAKFDKAAGQ
ncbi:MAG: N-acetylmuramoyl-L-alanine amidase [Acidobacteria bacterium]|nr:MAG: N-acetylmuramoyl-L-alanine amidase [Acidobacteriota bacterium]